MFPKVTRCIQKGYCFEPATWLGWMGGCSHVLQAFHWTLYTEICTDQPFWVPSRFVLLSTIHFLLAPVYSVGCSRIKSSGLVPFDRTTKQVVSQVWQMANHRCAEESHLLGEPRHCQGSLDTAGGGGGGHLLQAVLVIPKLEEQPGCSEELGSCSLLKAHNQYPKCCASHRESFD